jgi:uncharacterized protein (DUF342 family)
MELETGAGEEAVAKDLDAEVVVEKTTDELRATVQVFPPAGNGRSATRQLILDALAAKGVTFGIRSDEIDRLLAENIHYQPITVAEGVTPVHGEDAKIVYHYSKNQAVGLQEDEHGKIDFREMNRIINAKAGDLLVEKVPPVEGKPGTTVFGKAIPQTKGKDVRVRAGKDVRIAEDGRKFFAVHDGQVIFRNYVISIESMFSVEDVDASVGNIRFLGAVQIRGNVTDNYEVRASEGIFVGGSVGAATLEAGGDVVIAGGAFQSKVTAGGAIRCKFAQEAALSARGEIAVEEYLKNCQTRSHERVVVASSNGAHGAVIGGITTARKEITATNLGSEAEVKTEVRVGLDPDATDKLHALQADVEKSVQQFQDAVKNLQLLQKIKEQAGQLDAKKTDLLKKLLQNGREIRDAIPTKVGDLLAMGQATQVEEKGKVNVTNHTFPNVTVAVNGMPYVNKTLKTNCSYVLLDGDVTLINLRRD